MARNKEVDLTKLSAEGRRLYDALRASGVSPKDAYRIALWK